MKRVPVFEIYQTGPRSWRWRLKAGNREIVASGESYTREADARRGVYVLCEAAVVGSISVKRLKPKRGKVPS